MRYAELTSLPGTTDEAKSSIVNLITMYSSKNQTEIPMADVIATLHNEGYDLTPRMVMDVLQDNGLVKKSSKDTIYLMGDEANTGMIAQQEKEKTEKHVEKMAKKAIKTDSRKP